MKEKKIVFFDIDGTIYKFTSGIPKDTMESIKKMKDNGHIPVICTGRTRVMIYDEFLTPGFEYLVCGAGTCLDCHNNVEFLYEMKDDEISRVLKLLFKYNFSPVVEGVNEIYVEYENEKRTARGNKIVESYRQNIGNKCKDIWKSNKFIASKISAIFLPDSNINGVMKELGKDYNIVDHNGDLLELIPKPFSKATGIKKLIDKLQIPWENTYAFGDSFNDLEMLKYVKHGVCMGNSHTDLFKHTEYRTEDFDKGGITNALKRFGII